MFVVFAGHIFGVHVLRLSRGPNVGVMVHVLNIPKHFWGLCHFCSSLSPGSYFPRSVVSVEYLSFRDIAHLTFGVVRNNLSGNLARQVLDFRPDWKTRIISVADVSRPPKKDWCI